MDKDKLEKIINFQKNEITEYNVYDKLSRMSKDVPNKKILAKIAQDELRHYRFWKDYSKQEVSPDHFKINLYTYIAKILGLSFAVKLMELGEEDAQIAYKEFEKINPKVRELITDEDKHEMETLALIHDAYLKYAGSIVLGLNDALVELTGALAGLTFAIQNSRIIAVSGLVTGVAAAFSMGASEYLSIRTEEKRKSQAVRASVYTGTVYLIVVLLLVFPYLVFNNIYLSLLLTIIIALLIISAFSLYVSVVQQVSFKKQFLTMTVLSIGVAGVTFIIGIILRKTFHIEI